MPLLLYEIENGLLSRPARLAARLLYLTVHSVLTDRYIQEGDGELRDAARGTLQEEGQIRQARSPELGGRA